MEERINGYLYQVRDTNTALEISAEEFLAEKGFSAEEIKKIILEAE